MAPRRKQIHEYVFEPKHNMCALLQVTPDNAPVAPIIRWMARSNIRFALTESPVIYRSHILDFWRSAVFVNDENEKRIEATVAGQRIHVTERMIRRCLQLRDDDHNHIDFNTEHLRRIFVETMGYQGGVSDGQFSKGMFPLMYRFLIHHLVQGFAPRKGSWTLMSHDLANATVGIIYDLPFNFTRMIFDGLLSNLNQKESQRFLQYPRFLQIIFNLELQNLPETDLTHLLQDPNTFGRIRNPGPTNLFNNNVPFEILPWLLDHDLPIMDVPELSSEEDGDDEDDEESIDDETSNEGGDGAEEMEIENLAPEQGEHIVDAEVNDQNAPTPPHSPPPQQTEIPIIPSPPHHSTHLTLTQEQPEASTQNSPLTHISPTTSQHSPINVLPAYDPFPSTSPINQSEESAQGILDLLFENAELRRKVEEMIKENDKLRKEDEEMTEENVMLLQRLIKDEMIVQSLRHEVENTSAAPKQGENINDEPKEMNVTGVREGNGGDDALQNIASLYDSEKESTETTEVMDEEECAENVIENNATEELELAESENNQEATSKKAELEAKLDLELEQLCREIDEFGNDESDKEKGNEENLRKSKGTSTVDEPINYAEMNEHFKDNAEANIAKEIHEVLDDQDIVEALIELKSQGKKKKTTETETDEQAESKSILD